MERDKLNLGLEMWMGDIEAQLKSIKGKNKDEASLEEVRKELKEIGKDMKEIKMSMTFMNEQFEEWKETFKKSNEENKRIKEDMKRMQEEMGMIQKELKRYNIEKNGNDQEKYQNEIELMGVPKISDEKLKAVMEEYINKLNCKVQMKDIKECRYVSKREGERGTIRAVINKKENRDLILKKAKKVKITPKDLKISGEENRIYTNEMISKYAKNLLFLAKRMKEELKWKFVWVSEGKVLMRKDVGQKVVWITMEKDLHELREQERRKGREKVQSESEV